MPPSPADQGALLASVLRLLHNLAFDEEMRLQMVHSGLIPKASAARGGVRGGGAASGWQRLGIQAASRGLRLDFGSCVATGRGSVGGCKAQSPGMLWRGRRMTAAPCPAALLQAVLLLPQQPLQPLVLGLLYHLSMEDKHRSMFLYTGRQPRAGTASCCFPGCLPRLPVPRICQGPACLRSWCTEFAGPMWAATQGSCPPCVVWSAHSVHS